MLVVVLLVILGLLAGFLAFRKRGATPALPAPGTGIPTAPDRRPAAAPRDSMTTAPRTAPALATPAPRAAPQATEMSAACRGFLSKVKELDAIPGMASRLLQVLDDPKANVGLIGQEICRDQALMAMVLRMANSAFYGASGQVRDITESIVVLGYDTTRQLVMGRLSRQVLRKNDAWQKAMWRHALATALASQACAREVKGVTTAHAFTAGLLHDIGKAVMHEAFDDKCVTAWKTMATGARPSAEAEQAAFGTDHNEVGAELLKSWSFPEVYQGVARYHTQSDRGALSDKDRKLVTIVAVAGAVASSMGHDAIPDRSGPDPKDSPAFARLGAHTGLVDVMKAHVEKELGGLAEILA
jgi:putative nucleotidyltransferase with HDIG domain